MTKEITPVMRETLRILGALQQLDEEKGLPGFLLPRPHDEPPRYPKFSLISTQRHINNATIKIEETPSGSFRHQVTCWFNSYYISLCGRDWCNAQAQVNASRVRALLEEKCGIPFTQEYTRYQGLKLGPLAEGLENLKPPPNVFP